MKTRGLNFHLPFLKKVLLKVFENKNVLTEKKPYLKAITQNLCRAVVVALMGGKRGLVRFDGI